MAARWGAATVASRAVGCLAGTFSLDSVLALSCRLFRPARSLQHEESQRRGPRAERSRRGSSSDGRGTRVQDEDERRRVAVPARSRVGRRGNVEREGGGKGRRRPRWTSETGRAPPPSPHPSRKLLPPSHRCVARR